MKLIYKSKFLILGVIALSLQSCFVAKDYKRPKEIIPSEELFRTNMLPQDSTNIAEVSWQEMFTDPVLEQYIARGLENNIDIRIALQQILAAEAYVKQGRAAYFPTLNGNASFSRAYFSKNGQGGRSFAGTGDNNVTSVSSQAYFDLYELSGNLSWEADIWGRLRSNERAFEATYLQTVAAHQAVKTRLISDIATNYYRILALDEQKRIVEETIENRRSALETTKALKEAGILTAVAVQQTEAQLYTAQGILIDVDTELWMVENTLSILLGEPPHELNRTSLDQQQLKMDFEVGFPVELLKNRPDIIAAEFNIRNAFELTNVARSSFYPALRLTANGGFQSLDIKNLLDANSLFATLVGSLTQPILNGRRIRTEFEVSQSEQQQAILNFEQSLLEAGKEVSDALYIYEATSAKIEVKTKEFNAYELATNYSEELLDNGLANYLEVITARQNALNSRLDLVDARFNHLRSLVDLYRSLGGGWR